MNRASDNDILERLLAEIDRAWTDNKDRGIVYRLSREYPQFEDELHEFFRDLIFGLEEEADDDVRRAEESVHRWIMTTGLDVAHTTRGTVSTPPTTTDHSDALRGTGFSEGATEVKKSSASGDTWVAFLRRETKLRLPELAAALPHVTTEYLVLVSRHPTIVPSSVKEELAASTERRFGVSKQDSLRYLSDSPRLMRAASRPRPFENDPSTFNDLLDRSALGLAERAFWLNRAEPI
jgi:hypothetical protein